MANATPRSYNVTSNRRTSCWTYH
ncbi:hypothetical protein LINPERHAP1_LOCUS21587 [Linum perenne]